MRLFSKRVLVFLSMLINLFFLSSCSEIVTGIPSVRKSTVSGSFYPGNKHDLSEMIDDFLSKVEGNSDNNREIWGLITPHAGYEYSGQIAAYSYKKIKGKPYKTVIILAASHYMKYNGIAIYPDGKWETPLGTIEVDKNIATHLQKRTKILKAYTPPFMPEHSIEAQLPFLQKTLSNFKILPILFGQNITPLEFKILSEAISELLKNKTGDILVIASTDLSHYHEYSRAKIMDNIAIKNILSLDFEKLKTNLEQRNCEMCGAPAVLTFLMVADKLPTEVALLKYANSGDTVGNKNSVVGYSSIIFFYSKESHLLTTSEQKTLLKIARRTLEKYVRNRVIPDYDIVDEKLKEKGSVFVTLKKNDQLRGCIGNISHKQPLIDAVIEATIAAATKDVRFPRVTPYELSDIMIEISVLSEPRKIADTEEIEVGKHGLYLCNGLRCGVLLPQVAVESKWDREEFLKMVSLKAGLPPSAWKDSNSEIYIFTAQVFSESE